MTSDPRPIPFIAVPLAVFALLTHAPVVVAQGRDDAAGAEQGKLISLLDVEPSLYNAVIRYPKYYGDPNMVRGELFERSHLFLYEGLVNNPLLASFGYTTKDSVNFAVSERYLLGEILGILPVSTEEDNYGFVFTGSQYLWVRGDAQRKRSDPIGLGTARRDNSNPVGFGLTVRFGIVPSDRNVIDQFYSVGIGGWGGLPGRDDDNWGIGWAGSHISSDFRDDADVLGFDLDDFEHGVEAFYNFALTPAAHLSGHIQWIDPTSPSRDDIVALSARLHPDF